MTGVAYAEHLAIEAVPRAVRLVRALRDEESAVDDVTRKLDRTELVALITALAALVPADVNAADALEWIDLPPAEWSHPVLVREWGRWEDGDRDAIAHAAYAEMDRRLVRMRRKRGRAA